MKNYTLDYLNYLEKKKLIELAHKPRRAHTECYKPYTKQSHFHAAGKMYKHRLLLGGNQTGKTYAGAFEVCCHLTGCYPDWWCGHRFIQGNSWWVASVNTSMLTQNILTRLLPGLLRHHTGHLPICRDVSKLIVECEHLQGTTSTLCFRTYGQSPQAWQGVTLDGIWFDEEPPMTLYSEGLARTAVKNGHVIVTMTPLKGHTKFLKYYLDG